MAAKKDNSILAAAVDYTRQGRRVVPVPFMSKGPQIVGWQLLRLDEPDLSAHFNGEPSNLGLLLGEPSGGLVDVDLDCHEARELAGEFLPPTGAISGRPSSPRSHWWYVAHGAETNQHRDPKTDKMIVELRSTGAQTLVGPSVHPNGEQYEVLVGDPAVVDASDLAACVAALAEEVVRRRYGEPPKKVLNDRSKPTKKSKRTVASGDVLRRAEAYLDAMPEAISGQRGHAATYAAATAMVHGFGLDQDTALRLLIDRYNPRCKPEWTEKELRHKVRDAATETHERPLGWLRDAPLGVTTNGDARNDDPDAPPAVGATPGPALGQRDPKTGRLVLSPKRTLPTAQAYVREFNQHAEGRTLHGYGGLLMEWRGNRYSQVEEEWIKQRLQPWLHASLRYVLNKKTGEMELLDFESNPTTVKQALDTIRSFTHLPASTVSPTWLDDRADRPPALEILPCKTMNLHIPTGRILQPTPALFTINALDFDYDPNPEIPERWDNFLAQVFDEDFESVELLQEFMGYCLTSDTSQQKMLLLVGPRRSGKGTIGRILTRLVGAANVVGPTTSSLAGHFGLQPLIEKSLAIVSDARFGGENVGTVVERLLSISGEDTLTIDRKFLGSVSMKLPTRFMILTNELPRLNDASTALAGRFLVLRLTKSFYGNEDVTLTDQLVCELPGILLWAIEGWKRLKKRGRFVQPKSAEEAIRDLEDLASPVSAFVRECCVVGTGHRAWMDELYKAWQAWCEQDGRTVVTHKQSFGRDLTAAVPGIKRRRGTGMASFYEGIGLSGGEP